MQSFHLGPTIVALIGLSFSAVECNAQENGTTQSQQAALVDSLFKKWDTVKLPGCAVGVIQDGKLILAKGYGSASLDYNAPIDSRTTFQIASFTKAFTSLCIAMLMDEGKIQPDDDVRKFIPELHDFNTRITVRNLLRCHSGFRDYLHLMQLAGWPLDPGWMSFREDDVFDVLCYQKTLQVQPGKKFSYCNSDYFLLAKIVQRVSGKHISEFAKERIFQPLKMKRTEFVTSPSFASKNRAVGYEPRQIPKNALKTQTPFTGWSITGHVMGACGIRSCIADLYLWDQNCYDNKLSKGKYVDSFFETGGLLDNQFCLSVDAFRKTWNQQKPELVGKHRGLKFQEFTGGGWGFASSMARFPDQRVTLICLTNYAYTISPWKMTKRLAEIYVEELKTEDRLEPDQKPRKSKANVEKDNVEQFVRLPIEQLRERVGYFKDGSHRVWRITLANNRLHYTNSRGETFPLRSTKDGKFFAVDSPYDGDYFRFVSSKPQAKLDLVLHYDGGRMKFERVELFKPTDAQLEEFVGTYSSDELPVTYRFAVRENRLMLQIRIGRWEPLYLLSANRAVPIVYNQYDTRTIDFTRMESGHVAGFTISSGRAKRVPFKKL